MARLFVKHQPVEAPALRIRTTGYLDAFQVPRSYVKGIECQYVCFTERGVCFAARAMERSKSGQLITFYCKPMEDQPYVQEMLLADLILN